MTTRRKQKRGWSVRAAAVLGLVSTAACSGPPSSDVFRITTPLGPPTFKVVSDALAIHCGTLNCHGNDARNMRFFGFYGTRLNPKDQTGGAGTTDDEYEANFESIISIEPERLSQIVQSGGANEDKWIVLAKGRGVQHHKGGARMTHVDGPLPPGAPTDVLLDACVTSWITAHTAGSADAGALPGTVNVDACNRAAVVTPPGIPCAMAPPPCTDWTQ